MRKALKKYRLFQLLYQYMLVGQQFFRFEPIRLLGSLGWFSHDWRWYQKHGAENPNFSIDMTYRLPMLADKTSHTPLDSIYFHQDSWGVRQIAALKPQKHVDVGSSAMTMAMVAQFVPVTMVDIRPLPYQTEGLDFLEGSILDLPFASDSVESISSLCVVEHIGLGRYGDPLDVWGSEKAIAELQRVTRPGGHIVFSVPVDEISRIYFNAHRAFTPTYLKSLFHDCTLVNEAYIYQGVLEKTWDPAKGYGVGLFLYRKNG